MSRAALGVRVGRVLVLFETDVVYELAQAQRLWTWKVQRLRASATLCGSRKDAEPGPRIAPMTQVQKRRLSPPQCVLRVVDVRGPKSLNVKV